MSAHWTDERVDRLRALWKDGLSASQIASQLGGVTRNAVISKVHRLDLSGRAKPGNSLRTRQRQANADRSLANNIKAGSFDKKRGNPNGGLAFKAANGTLGKKTTLPKVAPPRPRSDLPLPPSLRVTLLDLRFDQCRYPDGEFSDKAETFCGHPAWTRPVKGELRIGPWCEAHARLCYQPPKERETRNLQELAGIT